MTAPEPRPLLLLDVDGVLNPCDAKPTRRPQGYQTHRISVTGQRGRALRVWLNPEHGPMLLAFAQQHGVELAWATTWEHHANVHIGPAIGLPQLPVIEWGFTAHHWKFDAVLTYAAGRPLAWLDDDFRASPNDRAWFEGHRGPTPTLLHHIDPAIGLRPDDLTTVASWLRSFHPDDERPPDAETPHHRRLPDHSLAHRVQLPR